MKIQFQNVPTARLTEVVPRTEMVLIRIISDGPEKFDIERIRNQVEDLGPHGLAEKQRVLEESNNSQK